MRLTMFFLGLLFLSLPAPAADVALEAGLARVDITPAASMTMYGYAKRTCGASNGTHDPLFAKVLVLRTGDGRVAIVTLDLGLFMSERLRKEVADKLGIPVLLLAPAFQQYATLHHVYLHGFKGNLGGGHWNQNGHWLAGDMIAKWLCGQFH